MKKFYKKYLFLSLVLTMSGLFYQASANTFTVTNTADSGPGSLRQAILDANSNPGTDIIVFNIATSGNLFEGLSPYTYAVIELNTALPTITGAVLIDGTTQMDTNTDSSALQIVGVDAVNIGRIAFPDVYIVPSSTFVFPTNSTGVSGNGISIDAANVTIKGIAISGFGNTNTNGGTASGHSDISILRSPSARIVNITISNCFISCDARGILPVLAHRKTTGNGILVAGNNETGTITNNYIAYSGTYGIHFNGNTDNNSVGPASTTVGNRNWLVSGNRIVDVTINPTINILTRVNDGITLMKCVAFRVINNYISNPEQMGIDIGYNSDSNYVANNTISGFTKTSAIQLQAGIRIGLCSESDTLTKNIISNNTSSIFKGGIWLDRSTLTQPGVILKNNINHLINENTINNNNGSGIVLSTAGSGDCYNNTITRNSIYENTGLGIDLDFAGTSGTTSISTNDDGDGDTGPNQVQNFPILDSVRRWSGNRIAFFGKAPAGSKLEFFISDGQTNQHGGVTLNYGEGKTFIGASIEGSADDFSSGTASYNVDGNNETISNLFAIVLPYTGVIETTESITSTATIGKNTSEFGPIMDVQIPLAVNLFGFSSTYNNNNIRLNWKAASDNDFLYFVVEHSTDGKKFSPLGTVYPKGIEEIFSYNYLHNDLTGGNHYYRLKMVNSTTKTTWSSVVHITAREVKEELLVNTVFRDKVELQVKSAIDQDMSIHLFDGSGKLVKYAEVKMYRGNNFTSLDNLENMAPGIYILMIKKGNESVTKKLIRQ